MTVNMNDWADSLAQYARGHHGFPDSVKVRERGGSKVIDFYMAGEEWSLLVGASPAPGQFEASLLYDDGARRLYHTSGRFEYVEHMVRRWIRDGEELPCVCGAQAWDHVEYPPAPGVRCPGGRGAVYEPKRDW